MGPYPDDFNADIVVYLTPWCPYCHMAKRLLSSLGLRYETHDVSGDDELRRWLAADSRQSTVPQIYIRGKSIGGFTELAGLERRGELRLLLDET